MIHLPNIGTAKKTLRILGIISVAALVVLGVQESLAQTPITLYNNFSGNDNYIVIGGTLRTSGTNTCAVGTSSSNTLTLPSGATVLAAYLYWAGSFYDSSVSTQRTPDDSVTFNGYPVKAQRLFVDTVYVPSRLPFFSGFADVTGKQIVGGSNTFSGLTVNTADPHCSVQAVVAGWGLVVVYSLSTELKHSINIYDGFQHFWGTQITFNPGNFYVPYKTVDGNLTHITWEGDAANSTAKNGLSEALEFGAGGRALKTLTNTCNPAANQFNSASNGWGGCINTTYGVDIDSYKVTTLLKGGDTSAVSTYATGQDLVILSCEVISISDTSSSDVQVTKAHSADSLKAGGSYTFTLEVKNNGPDTTGIITVIDSLPSGMRFQSWTAPGWTFDTSTVGRCRWKHAGPNPPSFKDTIKYNVLITHESYPSYRVYNTATDSSPQIDRRKWNNISTDSFTVYTPIFLTSTKSVVDLNGGATVPKDTLSYKILVKNSGNYASQSTAVVDTMPSGTRVVAATISPGGTVTNNIITFNTFYLKVGDSLALTYKAVVDSTIKDSVLATNVVHVRAVTVDQKVTASFMPTNIPVLTLKKSVVDSAGTNKPGDTLTYTLKYSNTGTDTARTVTLLDTIPSNTSYKVGSVWGTGATYDATGNRIVVSRSQLNPGVADSAKFKVVVAFPLPSGTTTIKNKAKIGCTVGASVSDSASVVITASSTMAVVKSAPSVEPITTNPDTFTFTINYSVTGTAFVDSAYLNDSVQTGLTIIDTTLNGAHKGVVTGRLVKWSLGQLTPTSAGVATIKVTTTTKGTYKNYVRTTSKQNPGGVFSDTTTTIIFGPHTGTINATATITPSQNITITVSDSDLVGRGTIIDTVKDVQTGESEALTLTETSTKGTFTGTLATKFRYTADASYNGIMAVQAGDSISTSYLDSANASGSRIRVYAPTKVLGGYTATISVTPTLIAAGDSMTFTLTDKDLNRDTTKVDTCIYQAVSKTGETENLKFVETGTKTGIFTVKIGTVLGTTPGPNNNGIFTAQPGDTITLSYFDSLRALGDTATIKAVEAIGSVNFSTSSKAYTDINGGSVVGGDTISYAVHVKNTGTATATSVTVTDTLPTKMTVVSGTITGGGTLSGQVISFPLFNDPANKDSVFYYRATIDSTIKDSSIERNIVRISANGVNQLDTSSFRVLNRPVMTMSKTVDKANARPGDTLTYTVSYSNIGTGTATLVTIQDISPTATTYIANSVKLNGNAETDNGGDGVVTVSGATITINVGQVAPGKSGNIKFKVLVK